MGPLLAPLPPSLSLSHHLLHTLPGSDCPVCAWSSTAKLTSLCLHLSLLHLLCVLSFQQQQKDNASIQHCTENTHTEHSSTCDFASTEETWRSADSLRQPIKSKNIYKSSCLHHRYLCLYYAHLIHCAWVAC